MSYVQSLALCTAQNVLGWSRTRFYGKGFYLSDLCLCAIAYWGARFVGSKAIAGGIFILDFIKSANLRAGNEVLVESSSDVSEHCSVPSSGTGVSLKQHHQSFV